MSDPSTHRDSAHRDSAHRDLEQKLASLAESISPREHVRDQMLERASETSVRTRSKHRSAQSILMVCAVLIVVSPVVSELTKAELPKGSSAQQLEQQAVNATQYKQSLGWSLVDVYSQMRQRMRSPHMGGSQ